MKKILLVLLFAAAGMCSCVDDDIWSAATIANVTNSDAVSALDDITVTATITSLTGVQEAALLYAIGTSTDYTSVVMTNDGVSSNYTAVIPAQALGTLISYYVEALSGSNDVTVSNTYTYTVGQTPVDYTGLCLNEINGDTKFIELYNNSLAAISLSGVYIIKDAATKIWTGASDLEIAAGGFILLYSVDVEADHSGYDADLLFNSGLSKKKSVSLTLYEPTDDVIDEFTRGIAPWGTALSDTGTESYALCPDGAASWQLAAPTPGTANPATGNGAIPQI